LRNPAPQDVLAAHHQRLKVLIADADAASRDVMRATLEAENYDIAVVANGADVAAAFMREQPDVVLMDVSDPQMNGFEAMQGIRALSGDSFVPVLFMTTLHNEEALAQCVAHGGNDFLSKPCSPTLLKNKVDSFSQVRWLYRAVKRQHDELALHHNRLKREYQAAEGVFAKVMYSSGLQSPNIKYLVSPQAIFNGDLLLAAYRPSGELHLLLGDFTGHGLSAAIGTIPVADIFNGMTAKGFPIAEIIAEINHKLHRILPRGLFFGAAFLELDAKNGKLSAWVGGVPDILIYGARQKSLIGRFQSKNFPLGVMETERLDCQVDTVEVQFGDRIFLYTDGLPETHNPDGAMFSQARLEQCFNGGYESSGLFEHIVGELDQFRGAQQQSDDVTLIEVTVVPAEGNAQAAARALAPRPASAWSAAFEFGADTLKGYDPLPMMMQVLLETQRLHQHKQRIYMVLAELFLNALEHGLLCLDSALKQTLLGFGEYYREKELRLSQLKEGRIQVQFQHAAKHSGGQLTIRVEDSGPGFDYQSRLQQLEENTGLHGRGILLVRSLCASLSYSVKGNVAEASYLWSTEDNRA